MCIWERQAKEGCKKSKMVGKSGYMKELLVGDGVIRGAMRNSATGVRDRDMCHWCTSVHDAPGRADRNNQSAGTDEHFIDSRPPKKTNTDQATHLL